MLGCRCLEEAKGCSIRLHGKRGGSMRISSRLGVFAIVATVVLAGAASVSVVRAEDFAGDVPDRVWIDVGGAYNDVSTISVQGPKGPGPSRSDIARSSRHEITARMGGTVRTPTGAGGDARLTSIDGRKFALSMKTSNSVTTHSTPTPTSRRFATQFIIRRSATISCTRTRSDLGSAGDALRFKVSLRTDGNRRRPR